jgi:hypothetical protein
VQVAFAGLAPGFSGLYQINVTVPEGITGDAVPVILTSAGESSSREQFDFLGYSFGPHRLPKDCHVYLGASPSKKSVSRLRQPR